MICSVGKSEKGLPVLFDFVMALTSSGHPPRIFDEISVRESLLGLRLSDNELTKSD